jgi:hypothetical protein
LQRGRPRHGLEAEVAPASRTVRRLGRIHVKAVGAADGRHRRVAMGAQARALRHPGAA